MVHQTVGRKFGESRKTSIAEQRQKLTTAYQILEIRMRTMMPTGIKAVGAGQSGRIASASGTS
ncbi:hypothetical protein [Rhizobium terrae]|uniref:hypothetical protein n=1 Tax=Rhizobium terrae TaxID=2171756 RepID=UPI0013C2F79B|nr:hypothetical protein [Rhizobium terrae]